MVKRDRERERDGYRKRAKEIGRYTEREREGQREAEIKR